MDIPLAKSFLNDTATTFSPSITAMCFGTSGRRFQLTKTLLHRTSETLFFKDCWKGKPFVLSNYSIYITAHFFLKPVIYLFLNNMPNVNKFISKLLHIKAPPSFNYFLKYMPILFQKKDFKIYNFRISIDMCTCVHVYFCGFLCPCPTSKCVLFISKLLHMKALQVLITSFQVRPTTYIAHFVLKKRFPNL